MTIILGVDPGSQKTGFGVIEAVGSRHRYIASGVIRLPRGALPARLDIIFKSLTSIIDEYSPAEAVVEEVFMAKSAGSALKLGQARGAAVVACVSNDVPVAEYTARQIKKAVVGTGAADKFQVQHMVKLLLKLPALPQEDAADALAAAICHANARQGLQSMAAEPALRLRRGRLK
ncbi:Crossover junction endodeoxyribonuclease RuvC [Zhongshania aliphaticivorans]|uniref:Crossover junction endodeoxyribonuclease RuvC n=1 Tax=Zhongshania aliphaticivorans TaxID=1470434 RepID=A0A5S9NU87_9GAMM|nr:crossover junction endodeoxyribonuclease RuvC [Zhongshania aliphaticivorans]CAA0094180.1 Crossover junction endodeoxyribonuclease RuvC [Zhongshania aliphaticivorans]CAA0112263.1 Crossover junction endodeoxyribonuclease RuvC [Zhongshania aliphaticivorans]